jgi:hypothetical protein
LRIDLYQVDLLFSQRFGLSAKPGCDNAAFFTPARSPAPILLRHGNE